MAKVVITKEGLPAEQRVFFRIDDEERCEMSFENLTVFGRRVLQLVCNGDPCSFEYDCPKELGVYEETLRSVVDRIKADKELQVIFASNAGETVTEASTTSNGISGCVEYVQEEVSPSFDNEAIGDEVFH